MCNPILSGAGIGLGFVMFGSVHARASQQFIPLLFALEFIAALAVYYLAMLIGIPSTALAIAAALCSLPLFLRVRNTMPTVNEERTSSTTSVRQLMVLAFTMGVPYGLMRNILSQRGDAWLDTILPFLLVGTLIAALLLLAVYFKQPADLLETCAVVAVPLTVASTLLLPFSGASELATAIIGNAGCASFLMLLFLAAADMAPSGSERESAVIKLLLLFYIANIAGEVLGAVVPPVLANEVSSVVVYAILVILIFVFSHRRVANAQAPTATALRNENADKTTASIDRLVTEHGLTERETDVLKLLIERRSYDEIADDLCVTKNTVKTHANNVYRKTGVSTRKDLIRLIEH